MFGKKNPVTELRQLAWRECCIGADIDSKMCHEVCYIALHDTLTGTIHTNVMVVCRLTDHKQCLLTGGSYCCGVIKFRQLQHNNTHQHAAAPVGLHETPRYERCSTCNVSRSA